MKLKKIALALLVLFIIAQFFGPEKNTGDLSTVTAFVNETKPNAEIDAILKNACYDCHSDHTRYPWYNNITPVNFWMNGHVEEGKEHLNFSKWSAYSLKKKDHKMEEVIETVEEHEMPLNSYTWTHGDAKLTDVQREAVIAWAKQVRLGYSLADSPQ